MRLKRQPPIERRLLEEIFWRRRSPAQDIANEFGLTRQTTSRYLRQMMAEGIIAADGSGRWTRYSLSWNPLFAKVYDTASDIREDQVWTEIAPALNDLSVAGIDICHHGITEMFNNALEASALQADYPLTLHKV